MKEIIIDENFSLHGNALQQLKNHTPYFPEIVKGVFLDEKYYCVFSTNVRLLFDGVWHTIRVCNECCGSREDYAEKGLYTMLKEIYKIQLFYVKDSLVEVDELQVTEVERLRNNHGSTYYGKVKDPNNIFFNFC